MSKRTIPQTAADVKSISNVTEVKSTSSGRPRAREKASSLTVEQVAEKTGLSTSTIYRRSKNGTFPASFKRQGKKHWKTADVEKWLEEQSQVKEAATVASAPVADEAAKHSIQMRGRLQPQHEKEVIRKETSDLLSTFGELLKLSFQDFKKLEPVIEWKRNKLAIEHLAAADLDFHGVVAPDPDEIKDFINNLPLQPDYWWITHGGGVRAIFAARDGMTAEELAWVFVHLCSSLPSKNRS